MLIFKNVAYKNFLSTGNSPIEIPLNTDKVTVVSGKNGCGKSSIIEAIYFAIYGKSFRKVNKDSLINSINKKNLLVTLELEVNKIDYIIKRGIKPNIFEIYVDGKLKPQTANVKDYQNWLQSSVLHMDEKTFRQVITMGSTSFIPFMRLTASERRTVIEDLLNVDIISKMGIIAKARANELKKMQSEISVDIDKAKAILEGFQNASSSIKENIAESMTRINNELSNIKKESENVILEITNLKKKSNKERYNELSDIQNKLKTLVSNGNKLLFKKQHILKQINDDINFFNNKSECPYCEQSLTKKYIDSKINVLENKLSKESTDINDITAYIEKLLKKSEDIQNEKDKLFDIEKQISMNYEKIESLKQKLIFFMKEKETYIKKSSEEKENYESKIQEIETQILNFDTKLKDVKQKLVSYDIIFGLLKDDGIKTVIIKNYLGIINALIKKYLNIIGYNIYFSFDANFNETIKSRGRDVFEYNCFSEGERLRIDFCLLFTFRELAKLRSTINTNLLIIDEQDGKLDTDGTSSINALLSSMDGNLIVISQYGDIYDEIATKQIIMEKDKHFSRAVVL